MRRQELSRSRRRLLELMRDVGYGRIENLTIRAGEPIFDESLLLFREVLLGRKSKEHAVPSENDFELKAQIMDLFEYFNRMQNGIIPLLKIQDGLPFQLHLKESIVQ